MKEAPLDNVESTLRLIAAIGGDTFSGPVAASIRHTHDAIVSQNGGFFREEARSRYL